LTVRTSSSRTAVAGAAFALALALPGCTTPPDARPEAPALRTPEERFSYALGARLGGDVRRSSHEIDRDALVRGVEDGLDGSATLSEDEIAAALKEGMEAGLERRDAASAARAEAAQREGEAFLASNRAREGVVVLPSGLQYEVLREGSGPVPGTEDFVTCHYRGTLLDGTVFDDTAAHGGPRTFQLTSVIDGFEEALLRMPAGSRWKLFVPPGLAYGERGAGRRIPPNATLVFEVELLAIGTAAAERLAPDTPSR
jgi:FKBP-type peptidyl-prolyl cis-trans isomerase FklB